MAQQVVMADMFPTTDGNVKVTLRNTCPFCGKYEESTMEVPEFAAALFYDGKETTYICDVCKAKKEAEERRERLANRGAALVENACIPPDFLNWDKAKGDNALARQIRDNRHYSLFISGINNCCKTRASAYNLMLEAKAGFWCKFTRFSELAAEYARICKQASENSLYYINDVLRNDLILIDDIGKRRITETAGELLYDMFDKVYCGESRARLWITSNKNLEDFAGLFVNTDVGDAVVSRIDRMMDDGRFAKIEVISKAK